MNQALARHAALLFASLALFAVPLPALGGQGAPPAGFVHLANVDPSIVQDIRYAGAQNFLGRRAAGYDGASCILTDEAARALAAVQERLAPQGLGLVVFDCYRPAQAVADFVRWAGEDGPADPRWHPRTRRGDLIREGYIASRSGHSRGSTVDLGLVRLEEKAVRPHPDCGAERGDTPQMLDFGTGFDCFDPRSHTASRDIGEEAQHHRMLLVRAMDEAGFDNYAAEWWHFTLRDEPYPKKIFDFPVTAP